MGKNKIGVKMTRHWVQTFKGVQFRLDSPQADLVEVDDICVSLSRLARFNGHTTDFYSVAQHSVYVSMLVPDGLALPALMHDAAEAYIGDIARPVKAMLSAEIHFLEKSILRAVAERFGFAPEKFDAPEIREADNRMLATEKRDLMGPAPGDWGPLPEPIKSKISPAAEGVAQQLFYKRYWEIMKWPDVRLGG